MFNSSIKSFHKSLSRWVEQTSSEKNRVQFNLMCCLIGSYFERIKRGSSLKFGRMRKSNFTKINFEWRKHLNEFFSVDLPQTEPNLRASKLE